MLRSVDLLTGISHQNEAFGRRTAAVVGHAQGLTVGLLCLLDGHAHRDADVDVQLLTGRILHVEQHVFPLAALLIIKKVRANNSRRYGLHVVDVDTGLKEEGLWVHVSLPTTVVIEAIVVRASHGQFVLQGVVAATDVVHHLCQPRLVGQTVVTCGGHLRKPDLDWASVRCSAQSFSKVFLA